MASRPGTFVLFYGPFKDDHSNNLFFSEFELSLVMLQYHITGCGTLMFCLFVSLYSGLCHFVATFSTDFLPFSEQFHNSL